MQSLVEIFAERVRQSVFFAATSFLLSCATAVAQVQEHPTSGEAAGSRAGGQRVVVPIAGYSDTKTAEYWAVEMAAHLQKSGAQVTLVLLSEAARLADSRATDEFQKAGEGIPIWNALNNCLSAGGKALVEVSYASAMGITSATVIPGASLADEKQIADAFSRADKVIGITVGTTK